MQTAFTMKRGVSRFVWVMVLALMCTISLATEDEEGESDTNRFVHEMIVRAHQRLTTALYKTFARKPGNLILSPWSVMTLLTVTYMVAGGRTANEIGDHLNINLLRRKEILAGFQHINEMFKVKANDSSETVESLNGALLGRKLHPSQRVERLLRENLRTYLHRVHRFPPTAPSKKRGGADSAPPQGNSASSAPGWVDGGGGRPSADVFLHGEKNPGQQLEGLVPGEEGLESRLSLWLFNWMSFRGMWRTPFDASRTHKADFWPKGPEGDPVQVDTMVLKASFPRTHYDQLEATLLELPYGRRGAQARGSNRHGLFIILPDKPDGLPRLEKKLRHFTLESMLNEEHWDRMAKVFLPKFKFKTDVMLNDVMKKLGFKRMFSPKEADFSRLNPKQKNSKKSPYVQTMIHRATIDVNENGTVASASTAMRLVSRKYVYFFRVNHPFMFVLRDKVLGINLFIGRVTDPRELS